MAQKASLIRSSVIYKKRNIQNFQKWFLLRSYKEWNGVYVRVRHSLILPLETDWETTLLRYEVELEWRLKVFPTTSNILFLNFTAPKYAFLFLNSETYIVHVINCEWSRSVNFPLHMFCMRYKHIFFQHRGQWTTLAEGFMVVQITG